MLEVLAGRTVEAFELAGGVGFKLLLKLGVFPLRHGGRGIHSSADLLVGEPNTMKRDNVQFRDDDLKELVGHGEQWACTV